MQVDEDDRDFRRARSRQEPLLRSHIPDSSGPGRGSTDKGQGRKKRGIPEPLRRPVHQRLGVRDDDRKYADWYLLFAQSNILVHFCVYKLMLVS